MKKNWTSHSPEETIRIAKSFAKQLKPGDVVALKGDLGSGKTTFIKGIAVGLGLKDEKEVKSPTFALMHLYPTEIPLYHFDLYRLGTLKEVESIGFSEFIHQADAVSCIEWADKAEGLIPNSAYYIHFQFSSENSRTITIL